MNYFLLQVYDTSDQEFALYCQEGAACVHEHLVTGFEKTPHFLQLFCYSQTSILRLVPHDHIYNFQIADDIFGLQVVISTTPLLHWAT